MSDAILTNGIQLMYTRRSPRVGENFRLFFRMLFTSHALCGALAFGQFDEPKLADKTTAIARIEKLGGGYTSAIVDVDLSGKAGLTIDDMVALDPLSGSMSGLNLTKSGIRDDYLEQVGRFTRLRILGLGKSSITDEGLRHLKYLRRLEQLSVSFTDVSGGGFAYLQDLPFLANLQVSGCPLTEDGLEQIGQIWSLETLNASDTPLRNEWLAKLKNLQKLWVLEVAGTRLTSSGGLEHLKGSPRLVSVDVSNTEVDDKVVDLLLALPVLYIVHIAHTRVTPAGVERLGDCPTLDSLVVSADQLPKATRDALLKKRPGLNIRIE